MKTEQAIRQRMNFLVEMIHDEHVGKRMREDAQHRYVELEWVLED